MLCPVMRRLRNLVAAGAVGAACVIVTGCPTETLDSGQGGGGEAGDAGGAAAELEARPDLPTVEVPAGPFIMGSDGSTQGGMDRERPRAERTTGAFAIDRTEVTNAAYALFLASEAARTHSGCHPDEPLRKDHTPSRPTPQERLWGAVEDPFGDPARADHPVVGVDWYDAYAFAAWAGRRLPNEDEWEKAARGTDGRIYPWGDDEPGAAEPLRATFRVGAEQRMTTAVGAHPEGASPYGALDMAGNVWEWTASPYLPYEGAPEGSVEASADHMVIRGGGWTSTSPFLLRAAMRDPRRRLFRSAVLGFRTVAAASPGGEQR